MSIESEIDPKEKFEEFFKSFKDDKEELKYRKKIQQLSIENKISIIVDFDDLLKYDAELAKDLLTKPEEIINAADQAALTLLELEDREYYEKLKNEDRKLFVRFRNLPSINHIPLRKIRSEHIGLLVMVDGILTRASEVKPRLVEAAFECLRCHYINFVKQETTEIVKPIVCENTNCRRNGPFRLVNEESKFEDWQKIRVQEKPEELPPGQLPRAIDAILTYDLVDAARPGDRVSVIGILRSTPEYAGRTKLSTFKIYLEANYIDITEKELEKTEITEEDEQKILELSRDPNVHSKIINSIAPSIYGLEDVKEAIALQLFGGVSKVLPDSMKIRGESNILLVGDPGTAKCVAPGALVLTASGEKRRIEDIVEEQLEKNTQLIDDGYYANGSIKIYTLNKYGRIQQSKANIFWKRKAPPYMIKIKTEKGKEITVTPTHLFYTTDNGLILCKKAGELSEGDFIATPKLEKLQLDKNSRKRYEEEKENVIPGLKLLLKKIRDERALKTDQMGIPELIYNKYESGELEASVEDLNKIIETTKKYGLSESLKRLTTICEADVIWDKVKVIEKQKPCFNWVYDLQVPGSNNFIANEFYVHNSQILQYTAQLAPRGLYTSGKGSSAAGLTAAVLKDESGAMALEAGALVLADKGLACLHPDTRIVYNGKLAAIGSVFNSELKFKALSRNEIVEVAPLNGYVISLDLNTLKPIESKTDIIRRKWYRGEILTLTFESGLKVTLTPEHKIINGDSLNWLEAAFFKPGDAVLSPSKQLISFIQSTSLKDAVNKTIKIEAQTANLNNDILESMLVANENTQNTIVSIDKKYYEGWVYDIHVQRHHNFLAEGVWVHNCIDEFDKMNPQDRVAIHEAMEQRTVSIAKAGIIATLNARTSILAAANPALGRYNEYRSPADNLKLPVTLLSRFDLIFILTDKPEVEKDRKIAEHILSLHRRESVEPPLNIDFLRKYITYAKRNCSPTISPEAAKKIEEFYLEMRKTGEGADSPVPITARQLEALIRLVEARARMALKKEATVDDAEAVIRLMKNCLRQVGVDRETGKMDIDIIMTGAPKSQRDKLATLLDVISTLEKENKGPVQIQEVIDRAKEYQLEEGFVKEALQRLLNDGTIFEPEPGYIKRTE
ncbi:MAG: hypothetical protein OdinLCB4_001950 [Candidatus Odinarchaeum yellowstonii]|uniref:DNA helicase n=1 Tax=Odinarchaeota yellowstonii (strain LCB_4) TaxID=1841599 RepID=A0AAF0D327_ODILC|nr:MAG: hypothetical protein OdinLCB4_001950 [Candidatus Odinarchaeum yellowstonii]